MPPTLRLSCAQCEVDLLDVPRNVERAVAIIREEAARGAQLVVFPELSLTGYVMETRDDAARVAQPVPGPATASIAAVCRETGVWAVVGLIERGPDGRLFNASVFIAPDGVRATYRKTHLPKMGIDRFLDRGDALLDPIEIHGVRVSCLICYDGTFPEPTRVLALRGADLVLLPTNWPDDECAKGHFMPATRALENVIWFAATNRVRTEREIEFRGQSSICDPGGKVVAKAGDGPCVIRAEVDAAVSRAKVRSTRDGALSVDRMGDRRPDLYRLITA